MDKHLIISNSPKDTKRIGGEIAAKLKSGGVIALSGDLGAGKTVFAKGVARALEVTDEVISPTFTLVRSYTGKAGITLHHFDAYRLTDEAEAEAAGLAELIGEAGSISVIEWPERIEGLLPRGTVWARISKIGDDKREIEVGE